MRRLILVTLLAIVVLMFCVPLLAWGFQCATT